MLMTHANPKRWLVVIHPLLFALRSTPRDGTTYSLSQLVYGRDMILPTDAILAPPGQDITLTPTWAIEQLMNIRYALNQVREQLGSKLDRELDRRNAGAKEPDIQVGEFVAI